MKKEYRKPVLYVESFSLVEHISAGCAYTTNFGNQCPIVEGEVTFFTSEPGCNEDGINMIAFTGIEPADATVEYLVNVVKPTCYNSLADYTKLFVS